ncbi:MAG: PKD repeat protein, partial [Chlorobi bacterium OLB7]
SCVRNSSVSSIISSLYLFNDYYLFPNVTPSSLFRKLLYFEYISPDDGITLEYSSDSGMAWNPIVRNARGGKYLWRVPNIESNSCLLRARQALFGISQQPHQWPQRIGGPKSESVSGIVADNAGHIFIAGYSTGEITDFGSSALKTSGGYVAKYSTDGRRIWVVQFTGIPSNAGKGIAIDNAGNLVITGRFFNKMDIGDTSLTAVGGADIFVAKFDSDGNLQWATQAGGIDPDQSQAVTTDKQGNIYITGSFFKRASFGEYELINTLIERNDTANYFRSYENAFVAKYSKDGKIVWVKKFDGISNTSRDAVYGGGISMDASGNLIVIGNFNGWIKYDTTLFYSHSEEDVFIGKFTTDGELIWLDHYGIPGVSTPIFFDALTIDSANNIILTVSINYRGYLLKFNTDGDRLLGQYMPSRFYQNRHEIYPPQSSIVSDKYGNIFLICSLISKTNIGIDTLPRNNYEGNTLVSKIHPDGTYEWSTVIGSSESGTSRSITLDSLNNIFVAGGFHNTGNFLDSQMTTVKYEDVFISQVMDITANSTLSNISFQIKKSKVASKDVDFGNVGAGYQKDTVIQDFIRNIGSYPISVLAIDILGEQAATFTITSPPPPFTIAPNTSYPVELRFLQSSTGLNSAQIRIITQSDTIIQQIQGKVISPALRLADSVIEFGQVRVGEKKTLMNSIQIINVGPSPQTIVGAYIDDAGDSVVSIPDSLFPITIQPNEGKNFPIEFFPSDVGFMSRQLHFIVGNDDATLTAQLIGEGINPYFHQLTKEIDFGQVLGFTSRDTLQAIMIRNNSDSTITITNWLVRGFNSSDFSAISTSPLVLKPNDTAKIDLRFTPSDVNLRNSQLFLEYEGAGSPIVVRLLGVGINPYLAIVNPVIDFGTKRDGMITDSLQIPTVVNINSLPLTITDVRTTTLYNYQDFTFEVLNKSVPFVLMPGDTAKTDVRFTVSQGSALLSQMLFEYDGIGSPTIIRLKGRLDPRDYVGVPTTNDEENSIRISPNPSFNQASLQVSLSMSENVKILIADLLGQQVKSIYSGELQGGENSISFNTSDLPTGAYYVMVATPKRKFVQQLIIER